MDKSRSMISNVKSTVFDIKFLDGDDDIELVQKPASKGGEILANSDVYIIQTMDIPKPKPVHQCHLCGRFYTSVGSLSKHESTCNKTGKKIGESCEELSMEEISQLESTSIKLAAQQICYCCEENFETAHAGHIRCQDCPKSFKTVPSYRRHVSFCHSSMQSALPCGICNAKCPTKWVLQLHVDAHQRGKPFACNYCGKEFTRRYHLYRHQQQSKCEVEKKQSTKKCHLCGKEFLRVDNLRAHVRQHMGEKTKPREFKCSYCLKDFVGSTALNIHLRTHTGERPFICDVCNKGFPSNGALRKHRRSHTGEKPFQCQMCLRCFGAKEVLNRHLKTHTGVRPHVCQVCGKSFIQATQLTNHAFIHTGKKPFSCEKCDYSFSKRKHWTVHAANFHSETTDVFDCKPCLARFETKRELIMHMEVHLNDKMAKCSACEQKFFNLALHTNCVACIICNQNDGPKIHKHINENAFVKTKSLKFGSADEIMDYDSESSQDAPRRKHKILTSKVKKEEPCKNSTVEIIIMPNSSSEDTGGALNNLQERENEDSDIEFNEMTMSFKTEEEIMQSSHIAAEILPKKEPIILMDDETLSNCIAKLLNVLLDAELLQGFGWPTSSLESVLSAVIKHCGHKPADYDTCADYATKIRENAKLLFTVVVDNDAFRHLLNNYTIDEVIQQIIQLTCP